LHMAQLMPLSLTVSCFSKIQIGFTFLVPAHLGSLGQRAVKRVCVKVTHTRLPSVGFWSWSRFLAVSLQVAWVINPVVGCHYFLPGLQLPLQLLRGLLVCYQFCFLVTHDGCEQFAQDCYPTASWLRFEPGPFCAWVQHANHSAAEPPLGCHDFFGLLASASKT